MKQLAMIGAVLTTVYLLFFFDIVGSNSFETREEIKVTKNIEHVSNVTHPPFPQSCLASFDANIKMNNEVVQGNVYWRNFGNQPDGPAFGIHVELLTPVKHIYAPAIFFTSRSGLYESHAMPPELDQEAITKMLSLFYSMQWSRDNKNKREKDGLGEYSVKYSMDGLSKRKLIYTNSPTTEIVHSDASITFNDQSCYWDSLSSSENIRMAIPELGGQSIEIDYLVEFLSRVLDQAVVPAWLKGSYQDARSYIANYKTPVEDHKENIVLPSFGELDFMLSNSNRTKVRQVLLALLEHEAFINKFIDQLSDGNELSSENVAKIISLLAVKNTEATQQAVWDIFASEDIHVKHLFQAAIALGDFQKLYLPEVLDSAFYIFSDVQQPIEFRSALIASVGRLASNIQDSDPGEYTEIVDRIYGQLPDVSHADESAGLVLDALYNSKAAHDQIVESAMSYASSQRSHERVRASAILANAGRSYELGVVLENEPEAHAQKKIISIAEVNNIDISDTVVKYTASEASKVRTQALKYLSRQPSLSPNVLHVIANQFGNESKADNRAYIIDMMQKYNILSKLSPTK